MPQAQAHRKDVLKSDRKVSEDTFLHILIFSISCCRDLGIPAACTVRKDRMDKCPLKSEKELKAEGRGSMDFRLSSEGILVLKWFDNKEVTVASNHYSAEPITLVRRWDKKEKAYVNIPRPALIDAYNKGMGGVDACDQLLSFYRLKTKSPKWYKRILYHYVDVAVVNSFILRKAMIKNPKLPLFEFKLEVAKALMYAENFAEPLSRAAAVLRDQGQERAANGDLVSGPDPPEAVRLDGAHHWPSNAATIAKCCRLKGCKARTKFWCSKCRAYLCIKKGQNCFLQYHSK
jgi:hypothetical protein